MIRDKICFGERFACSIEMGLGVFLLALWPMSGAFGQSDAPPASDKTWQPPGLHDYQTELEQLGSKASREQDQTLLATNQAYHLPELIDLAERVHPQTRAAWERARQAAHAVGLAQSAYYPWLVASAAAGYEQAFLPFPTLKISPNLSSVSITGGGTLTADNAAEGAALNLKWLLFDFGERKAVVSAAREGLMAANVSFNAVHQLIVFEVTRRFYEFDAARQKVALAENSLEAAQTVARAAQLRLTNGLATKPEVLQSEQLTAQADFDLEAARGFLSDAQVALVESIGVLPTFPLSVAAVPEDPVVEKFDDSLETLIDRALSQRPDLVAKLALVRARRDDLKKAKAEYYPKISMSANVGGSELDVSVKNSPYFGGAQPVYGVGLGIEFPLFDGFSRKEKRASVESQLRAAENELAASRDTAVREVWKAYTDFRTAYHKQESAAILLSAAQSAFDASMEAYRRGLGTYVDVVNAQRNLMAARTVSADTRSAIYISKTALALSMGDLAKPANSVAAHHP